MRLLLESLACLRASARLRNACRRRRRAIESASEISLSVASIWEIAIKRAAGKLALPGGPDGLRDELLGMGGTELPIRGEHALRAASLPLLHRDPFDRMLVAQAELEGMTLVTADELVRSYGGRILWAGR